MLSFAALCPHPLVIVPEIGKTESKHAEKTHLAMQTLGKRFAETQPDKVLIISPHTLLLHNMIAVSHASELSGRIGQDLRLSFNGEKKLTKEIHQQGLKNFISIHLTKEENDTYPLSHGEIVPLYFLAKNHSNFDLVVSGFSDFTLEKHFEYGKILGEIIHDSNEKIAFIASGDLSHRLKIGAPAGYSPYGEEFDKKLLKYLQRRQTEKILKMDPHIISEAEECGLRSIVVLLGILEYYQYQVDLLSYEAPFGVGYAVADFKIKCHHSLLNKITR